MPLSTQQVGGVYWRMFAVTIPVQPATVSILEILKQSVQFNPALDGEMVQSPSAWLVGLALKDISGTIRIYGAMPTPNAPGSARSYAPDTTIYRTWDPTVKGDWTENCTDMLDTVYVAGNAAQQTANLVCYYKRRPFNFQRGAG